MLNLGSPDQTESPWFPLFMVSFCALLIAIALYYGQTSGAALVGLLLALNVWRLVGSWRRTHLEKNLKRDPELWRLYQERRKHDD